MLCSPLFIIHGTDHDCIGAGCAICNCAKLFAEMQKIIALACGIFVFAHLFMLPLLFYITCGQATKAQHTPITLKVKLLN